MLSSLGGDKHEFYLVDDKLKNVRCCPRFYITHTWLHRMMLLGYFDSRSRHP